VLYNIVYNINKRIEPGLIARLCFFSFLFFNGSVSFAQVCPPNLDFETGTFNNWKTYSGSVAAVNGQNVITLNETSGPFSNQHKMNSSSTPEYDYFGGFPVNCPNGSGYSVKLGNDQGGGQAEGLSYEFTIPANRNVYSLIYHYAVVFEDPNHPIYQQPRLEIEITNITDNHLIECSSFSFYPIGSALPGFTKSDLKISPADVWYKDWSPVSINLNGLAGKTIRLFFKTADCTFTRHFGYAYIDVNSECSDEFVGASYCPDDTLVNVSAPYGYQGYNWYNQNFSASLGSQQTITLNPPPPPGTVIAVEIIPYSGYGCLDTLYARMIDTLTITANAGKDAKICNQSPVSIGNTPKPGLVYKWSPSTGLSNPNIANPRAGPATTTTYILTVTTAGGGCRTTDTVVVTASTIDTSLILLGKESFCITSMDSAVLIVQPTDSIQWFFNNSPIKGANKTRYKATQSGLYKALLFNDKGCIISTATKTITIDIPRPGLRYAVQNAAANVPLQLQARNIGVSYLWNPPVSLNNSEISNPVFNGSTEKDYTISINTSSGCNTVDTQLVRVFKEVNFYVPTVFTPNMDGKNDYLKPLAAGIKEFKYFRVYNRWGQLLFDLKSNAMGWDGTFKGLPLTTQTVVWIAEGVGMNNKNYTQKGTTVLLR
jgi:gliding motility-associated-like protein